MKLKLLLLSLFGAATVASAQYTVKDDSGAVLNEGDVVEFGSLTYPEAEFEFFVTNNNSSETIYSRIEYVSETNANDAQFSQLCYGVQCYYQIPLGTTVPPATDSAAIIPGGETTGIGNHFFSDDPGNGTDNVDFVFTFRQYESENSMTQVGETLTFTYRYNPTLSVNNVSKVNLSLISNMVTDQLMMDVNEPVQMQMFDIQGRLVKQAKFETGHQVLNVSDLSSQQYIVQFKNQQGAMKTSKIIIK